MPADAAVFYERQHDAVGREIEDVARALHVVADARIGLAAVLDERGLAGLRTREAPSRRRPPPVRPGVVVSGSMRIDVETDAAMVHTVARASSAAGAGATCRGTRMFSSYSIRKATHRMAVPAQPWGRDQQDQAWNRVSVQARRMPIAGGCERVLILGLRLESSTRGLSARESDLHGRFSGILRQALDNRWEVDPGKKPGVDWSGPNKTNLAELA